MSRIYLILGALAVIGTLTGSAYLKGRSDGRTVERIEQLQQIERLNDELQAKNEELAELERQRLERIRQLEDQTEQLRREADEDPNANRPALGADSMRRLNSLGQN